MVLDSIQDVPSFLKGLYELKSCNGVRCFRGEADLSWRIQPSVMRGLKQDAERNILSELTLEVSEEFETEKSMFRKLVRAQHYGLPTRLLDVSLNPLVALYFACFDEKERDKDGKLVIFDCSPSRIKFADSDTVSVLSNLALLSDTEKKAIDEAHKTLPKNIGSIAAGQRMEQFNQISEVDRLTQFIRIEKPYFRPEINPTHVRQYYFVHPHKNNRRIVAQSGAFILAGIMKYQKLTKSKPMGVSQVKIPSQSKGLILDQLDKININSRTLFPEIEAASDYIKQKWRIGESSQ